MRCILTVFNIIIVELEEFIESTKSVEFNKFIKLKEFENSEKNA